MPQPAMDGRAQDEDWRTPAAPGANQATPAPGADARWDRPSVGHRLRRGGQRPPLDKDRWSRLQVWNLMNRLWIDCVFSIFLSKILMNIFKSLVHIT